MNPGSWYYKQTLSSAQANQLDINSTYCLDKRDGYTDTLQSQVTVDGGLTFATGCELVILDPTVVTLGAGNLSIASTLIGSGAPLLTGYVSVAITSTSQTLTSAQAQNSIFKLTGTLTNNTTVLFPAIAGYSCIVDNGTTADGYSLTISTASATNGGVQLPSTVINNINSTNEKAVEVYCDGTNLNQVVFTMSNQTVNLVNASAGGSSLIYAVTGLTSTAVPTLTLNVTASTNDLLEISFNGVLLGDGSHQATMSVYVNSTQQTATILNNSSVVSYATTSNVVYYKATSSGVYTITVQLVSNNSGGVANLYAPASLTVKTIRP